MVFILVLNSVTIEALYGDIYGLNEFMIDQITNIQKQLSTHFFDSKYKGHSIITPQIQQNLCYIWYEISQTKISYNEFH